jgi:ABC-type multidrug transport system fused ATPase/permease subunit
MSELENAMTSVERLVAFSQLPTEASPASPPGLLPAGWPTLGAVQFDKLTVAYSPSLPPTLNGVSFTIPPGAKLGLLGRTGAGKSTLISALFRLVENEGCSGRILIDGIDIARRTVAKYRDAMRIPSSVQRRRDKRFLERMERMERMMEMKMMQ